MLGNIYPFDHYSAWFTGRYPIIPCLLSVWFDDAIHRRYASLYVNKGIRVNSSGGGHTVRASMLSHWRIYSYPFVYIKWSISPKHHKSKQRWQKVWDEAVVPGVQYGRLFSCLMSGLLIHFLALCAKVLSYAMLLRMCFSFYKYLACLQLNSIEFDIQVNMVKVISCCSLWTWWIMWQLIFYTNTPNCSIVVIQAY